MMDLTADGTRLAMAAAVLLAYALFCAGIIWRERRRVRMSRLIPVPGGADQPVLVAFASQTGFGEYLAKKTVETLKGAGTPARLVPLGNLDAATLASTRRALFIAATTGEGDVPDHAARFVGKTAHDVPGLPDLHYGLLALGDRAFADFCAFGHMLDDWLRHQGATPLFDLTEVDDGDAGALRHWQSCLGFLTGRADIPDWSPPVYGRWVLVERRLLNPGSRGGPAFHLAFRPLAGEPAAWVAGDIAEIGPRNDPAAVRELLERLGIDRHVAVAGGIPLATALQDRLLPHDDAGRRPLLGLTPDALLAALKPLPHREYSIASLPADGTLDLLVRRMAHPDGRPGLGSGWLTEHAAIGGEIALRIRTNRNFHGPDGDRPMLLIGNGTGLAGLRAHLRARIAAGQRRNWLVFGERSAAHDFFHRAEIEGWLADGHLTRLDLAFSRDQEARIYVQDRLRAAADEVRRWVRGGAAIYVCGSLEGMAGGVDAALADIVGRAWLDGLIEEGRYRRDVY